MFTDNRRILQRRIKQNINKKRNKVKFDKHEYENNKLKHTCKCTE